MNIKEFLTGVDTYRQTGFSEWDTLNDDVTSVIRLIFDCFEHNRVVISPNPDGSVELWFPGGPMSLILSLYPNNKAKWRSIERLSGPP